MYTLRVDCTPSLHTLVYDLTKQVHIKVSINRFGSWPLHSSSFLYMNACRYAVQRRERRESLCTTAGTRGTTGRVCAMHRGRKPLTCAELWNQKSRSNSANQWIGLFSSVFHIAGSVNSGQAATLRLTSSAWESLQAEPDTLRTRWDMADLQPVSLYLRAN